MKKFFGFKKSNSEIINSAYKKILKREPDKVGLKHYLPLLEKNEIDEKKLIEILKNSNEYKDNSRIEEYEQQLYELGSGLLSEKESQRIVNEFHKLYFYNYRTTVRNTFWMGVQVYKCPLDLWIYQEILFDTKPDLIIETGTFEGGSALFLASLCDWLGRGEIITIDIDPKKELPYHNRIHYIKENSISTAAIDEVNEQIKQYSERTGNNNPTVMCILDSNHNKEHVLQEMKLYNEFVTVGNYLIVEDTDLNGNPLYPNWGPGPMEAVNEFLKTHDNFRIDIKKEKFFITLNPNGYLQKYK